MDPVILYARLMEWAAVLLMGSVALVAAVVVLVMVEAPVVPRQVAMWVAAIMAVAGMAVALTAGAVKQVLRNPDLASARATEITTIPARQEEGE